MLLYLHDSPLFFSGISSEQLISALSSLKLLFSDEDDNIYLSVDLAQRAEWLQATEVENRERPNHYDLVNIQGTGIISRYQPLSQEFNTTIVLRVTETEQNPRSADTGSRDQYFKVVRPGRHEGF
jgi:hypothetical protein